MKLDKQAVITFSILGLIILFLFKTCDSSITKGELEGCFVYNNSLNAYDTLFVFKDGTYSQKLYDLNKKLVYESANEWKFSGASHVDFLDFHLNDDAKIYPNADYTKVLMYYSLVKAKDFGTIKLIYNLDLDRHYKKID